MHENLRRLGWMAEWLAMSERGRELFPLADYMAGREEEERARRFPLKLVDMPADRV